MAVVAATIDLSVSEVKTSPIAGQKPGTSGLRKKTKEFMKYPYLHNYVQSVFNTLKDEKVPVEGGTLVVSGDGRYWNDKAIQIIIKMAFANGVKCVWVGTNGLLSTPATSAVIRSRGGGRAFGGFICSASHNPGGPEDDFGIKYNSENGGPAPDKVNDQIVAWAAKIDKFLICDKLPDLGVNVPITFSLGDKSVEVFDCVEDHLAVLKECFDFEQIKKMVARPDFTMVYDSMCAVQGPYAKKIIEGELGAKEGSATNAEPREDFGGKDSPWHGHADPNLTYAVELVATMGLDKGGNKISTATPPPNFGAAADGDADRNMVLSSQFFVSPSDSVAMIVANSHLIPQFKQIDLKGCARSMPTSGALDLVAKKLGIECFETPTGWKFFGNLMDSGNPKYFPGTKVYTPFICGEESFGTGADHVREKDGMWAVLAWLQILAAKTEASGKLVSIEDVANAHWKEFGRNYYARYDYEGVDKAKAEEMMAMMSSQKLAGTELQGMKVKMNDVFEYTDPVDGSVAKNQGIRVIFEDGSRIIFRLSGTGVEGATVRLYLEKYEAPSGDLSQHQFEVVKPLAKIALEISKLAEFTGRNEPSVIT